MIPVLITRVKTFMKAKEVLAAVRGAKIKRLQQCALLVEREAKISMHGAGGPGGPGRDKKSGLFTSRAKQPPSPVGEPPHVKTGNLRASISTAGPTPQKTELIGPTREAWYGRVHEFSKRFPRPFMIPALLKVMKLFPALFKGILVRMPQQ